MTQTIRRELRIKFEAILSEYDAQHEGLAERLADAALLVSGIRRTDETRPEYKLDIVDAVVKYQILPTTIRTAVHEYFRLNTNWETKMGREWLEWAVGAGVTPEQLKRAADTWRNDKAFNWQTPTLRGIFEKWEMLMDASPVAKIHKVYDPAEDERLDFVPAPARMR